MKGLGWLAGWLRLGKGTGLAGWLGLGEAIGLGGWLSPVRRLGWLAGALVKSRADRERSN